METAVVPNTSAEGARIYDRAFYEGQSAGSFTSALQIVPIIIDLVKPCAVADVGCGVGTWLRVFKEHGVEIIRGYDGDYVNRADLMIDPELFHPIDLRAEFTIKECDLVVCLEVAEHLPSESGASLIQSLVDAAPLILFSAAIPGQGGTDHINEKWQDYWRGLFAEYDYQPIDIIRPKVWGLHNVEAWYQQNIILYGKSNEVVRRGLSPVRENISLNLVHPMFYGNAIEKADTYFTKSIKQLPVLLRQAVLRRLSRKSG